MYELPGSYTLRRPEPEDLDALYLQKNDPDTAGLLGGFSTGYSREDLRHWLEAHRTRRDEVLWAVLSPEKHCIGHVGLYEIDHRVRQAEFAILLGDIASRGKGVGRACLEFAVGYAFDQLNVRRVSLSVLASNARAIGLYASAGFEEEGRLREAQYKGGQYHDVVLMARMRAPKTR